MTVVVITGSQWGDEGKGKLAHYLGADFDLTVRFQGGSNAGHTVKTGGETYKFNLLPSAILHRDHQCLMADGMVVNPGRLIGEIGFLQEKGLWSNNLLIGSRAHLVMPYHILQDELHEKLLGSRSIGTTKQGIGPCYADKFSRSGIQVGDLVNPKTLRQRLEDIVPYKNALLRGVYGFKEELSVNTLYDGLMEQAEVIAPLVVSSVKTVRSVLGRGANVLCEGAQGALLDIDYGTYPFVTSSHTVSAGACLGTGIAPSEITRVIGVSKAYATRVGNGTFPSELTGVFCEHMREHGLEYGTTTGRPRRCGWLDLVLLKYALRINGCTELALTKIDVLDGLESVNAVVAYKKNGETVDTSEMSDAELAGYTPEYAEFAGWTGPSREARTESDLAPELIAFVDFVEQHIAVPVRLLSVGPDHDETVLRASKL